MSKKYKNLQMTDYYIIKKTLPIIFILIIIIIIQAYASTELIDIYKSKSGYKGLGTN